MQNDNTTTEELLKEKEKNHYLKYWVIVPILLFLGYFILSGLASNTNCEHMLYQGLEYRDCGNGWEPINQGAEW